MISVLQVIAPTALGGAENVLLSINNLADKLNFRFYYCIFISSRAKKNQYHEKLEELNCDVSIIYMKNTFEIRNIVDLIGIIKEKKIQLIHAHGYRSDIIGLIASKVTRTPIISTVHGWTSATFAVKVYEFFQRKALRYFDKVIAVSQQIHDVLRRDGLDSTILLKINNSIDYSSLSIVEPSINLRNDYGIDSECPIIGVIGRFSVEKGHIILLRAISILKKEYPSIRVLLIGDGDEADALKKSAMTHEIDDMVIFCGHHENVYQFYSIIDVFVLPSFTEGIPLVLLEAMFFKKPIIASDVGGIPEVIEDGHSGELVPPGDPFALAERITKLIKNRQYAQKIAEAGHKHFMRSFSPDTWIRKIESTYEDALK